MEALSPLVTIVVFFPRVCAFLIRRHSLFNKKVIFGFPGPPGGAHGTLGLMGPWASWDRGSLGAHSGAQGSQGGAHGTQIGLRLRGRFAASG